MKNISKKLITAYLYFCVIWVIFALLTDITFIYLNFTNPPLARHIINEVTWKMDNTFKK